VGSVAVDLAKFRRQHRPWNPKAVGVVVFVLSAVVLIYAWGLIWGTTLLLALFLALVAAAAAFYRDFYALSKFIARQKEKATRGQ